MSSDLMLSGERLVSLEGINPGIVRKLSENRLQLDIINRKIENLAPLCICEELKESDLPK